MAQIDIKYFTPQDANKTLPLVKQIVKDILTCANKIKDLAEQPGIVPEENSDIKELSEEIKGYISELDEIGCNYKDWSFDVGLVDFPSVIEGKDVLLCWRSDEVSVKYFHGMFDGFAGRKLIPEEYL